MKFSRQAEVIGFYWCSDVADVRDSIYQPTRLVRPNVYTSGNEYWAATKGPKPRHEYAWTEVKDSIINEAGWKLWKAQS